MIETNLVSQKAFELFKKHFKYPPELRFNFNDKPARHGDYSCHGLELKKYTVGFICKEPDEERWLEEAIRDLCHHIMDDIDGAHVVEFSDLKKFTEKQQKDLGFESEVIRDGIISLRVIRYNDRLGLFDSVLFDTKVEVLYGTA